MEDELGTSFDVLVLGAGSAGYAAAGVAGEMGARVGLVEGGPIGGLCILDGCMPSKALLQSVHLARRLRTGDDLGVRCASGDLDFARAMARKRRLVAGFAAERRKEIEAAPGVTLLRGRARFSGPGEVVVERDEEKGQGGKGEEARQERRYTARKVIVATGSYSYVPPLPGLAEVGYLTSDQALRLEAPPPSLIILGGGAIAVELGQLFARAGTRVTLLQRDTQLLSDADPDVSQALTRALRGEGLVIHTGAEVERCDRAEAGAGTGLEERGVRVQATVDGERRELFAAQLLVATGRRGRVSQLNPEAAGVALDEEGCFVAVDGTQRTSHPDVYAAGDVATRRQMTHLAVQQGEVAGYNAAWELRPERSRSAGRGRLLPRPSPGVRALPGLARVGADGRLTLDGSLVPRVLFTEPAYARVGRDEQEARAEGIAYAVARYDFADVGMAVVMEETQGFLKLLARRA